MKDRTFFVSASGKVSAKRKSSEDTTIRARNLREAIARHNIETAKRRELDRFAKRAESFGTMGSALLRCFGAKDLKTAVG